MQHCYLSDNHEKTVTVIDESEETDEDNHDVNEYEPETGDEAERPPQV